MNRIVGLVFLMITVFGMSCTKSKPAQPTTPPQPPTLSSDKEIISFKMRKWTGFGFLPSEQTVAIQANGIVVHLPAGTDITRLYAEVVIRGVSISPDPSIIRDYTNPIVYTVTAQDGSTKQYTVVVMLSSPSMVYFGSSNKNFYALNITTGALQWSYTGTSSFAYSSPTYANGVIYVGSIDSKVYAFNAMTGAVIWTFQAGNTGVESDAVIVDGTVYVGCNDDFLVAINASTGQEKWRYMTGANISSSPTVGNGKVYFGSSDGKVYAVDTATGNLSWSFTTGGMINQSGAALVNNVIYVGSRDGHLYAIDALTGQQKWKLSSNGISFEQSSPTVANGVVYIGAWYDITNFNRKGSFYAVNAITGQVIWEKLLNTAISSSPSVGNGKVYVTADDLNLHCLDIVTGATSWTKQILSNSGSPVVTDGTVFSGGGGTGYFYSLNAVTGAENWKFATPQGLMTSSPLVITPTGQVYYPGDSGQQY